MKIPTCLLLAMALPLAALAQDTKKAATKPVILSSYRVMAKPGHGKQLEAALAAHARKYHKEGLKGFDEPTPAFRKTADELFGAGEYDRLQQSASDNCSKIWGEIIEFKPALGSP